MYLFTEERIRFIADAIYKACLEDGDLLSIKRIQTAIEETDKAIENLWNALEQGQSAQRITERINKREAEKKELEKQLAIEKRKKIGFDYDQILAYLDYIKSLSCTSIVKRKALVTIFVNRIYLYDEYFTLILNGGNSTLTIENIPLNSIENKFNSDNNGTFFSSPIDSSAPPKIKDRQQAVFYLYIGAVESKGRHQCAHWCNQVSGGHLISPWEIPLIFGCGRYVRRQKSISFRIDSPQPFLRAPLKI